MKIQSSWEAAEQYCEERWYSLTIAQQEAATAAFNAAFGKATENWVGDGPVHTAFGFRAGIIAKAAYIRSIETTHAQA